MKLLIIMALSFLPLTTYSSFNPTTPWKNPINFSSDNDNPPLSSKEIEIQTKLAEDFIHSMEWFFFGVLFIIFLYAYLYNREKK